MDHFFHHFDKDPKSSKETDGYFWNLMILGVLAFKGLDDWDQEFLWWANQQEHVQLTARGRALLQKIHSAL